jgi:hypothetical protein
MPTARIPQYAALIISRPQTLLNHFYATRHHLAPVTKGEICRSTAVSVPKYQLEDSQDRLFSRQGAAELGALRGLSDHTHRIE